MQKTIAILLFFTFLMTNQGYCQFKNWECGTLFYFDYNAYRWDHRASNASVPNITSPKSIGQALNLLPSIQTGLWFGDKRWGLAAVESGVRYFPFSLDLGQNSSSSAWGTLSFPLMAKAYWLLSSSHRMKNRRVNFKSYLHAAYGQEWVIAGVHYPQNSPLPLTQRLHIFELGAGNTTDGISFMTFFKFGFSNNNYLFEIGLRGGWDSY